MAKFLLGQSLRLVWPSATSFVCPRRWCFNGNSSFRHMLSTSVMGTVDEKLSAINYCTVPGTTSFQDENATSTVDENLKLPSTINSPPRAVPVKTSFADGNNNYIKLQQGAATPRRVDKFTVDENGKLPSIINSSPWLMLPSENNHNKLLGELSKPMTVHKFYTLSEKRVITINKNPDAPCLGSSFRPDSDAHCVGSCYGWLGFINRRPDFEFFLLNPITGRCIKLPLIRKLDGFWSIWKFVMSSPNPDAEDCRVVILFKTSSRSSIFKYQRLAFCCPGLGNADSDSSLWTLICNPKFFDYMEVEYSPKDKRFFAMSENCYMRSSWENEEDVAMDCWDLSDPRNPKSYPILPGKKGRVARSDRLYESFNSCILKNPEPCYPRLKSYLIADPSLAGQLFWIDRFTGLTSRRGVIYRRRNHGTLEPHRTVRFDVYKFDTSSSNSRRLEYMESLDDRALFIGSNGGFWLSAKDYPELNPNSIYFTDDVSKFYHEIQCGCHDIGIYNYKDKTIEECYYPLDKEKYKEIEPAPVWFTPTYN